FAFSDPSVMWARFFLFLTLALALGLGIVIPLIQLNRRRSAREAERQIPEFEERLLTFAERVEDGRRDPFLELLAADTLTVADHAEPERVARRSWIASFATAAACAILALVWLATSGPGFLGYGTSLLWGALPKNGVSPFYDIQVQPGSRTVRKRSDQIITARLIGFQTQRVRLFARYRSASKWEQADMRPQADGPGFEFVLAGIPESLEYFVEAGGVRSKNYKLQVLELPGMKHLRVTYKYPAWTGFKESVEDPGGDLRAVEGTVAEVE